jgi:hypothetical protein
LSLPAWNLWICKINKLGYSSKFLVLIFCRQKRKKRGRKEKGGKQNIEGKRRGGMIEKQERKKKMLKLMIQ